MIRFAKWDDIPQIMSFIGEHWQAGHILSRDREMLLFQHKWGDELAFVLSVSDDGAIDGMIGYIPYGGGALRDVAACMWRALSPMAAVRILRFLLENGRVRLKVGVGANPKTSVPIFKALGFATGRMTHWYRLNPAAQYSIASIKEPRVPQPSAPQGECRLARIEDAERLEAAFDFSRYTMEGHKPYKELGYIKRRYFEHPIYKYAVYGAAEPGKKAALLLVLRKEERGASCALRLVDCIGEHSLLPRVTAELDSLLAASGAECIDLYEAGLPSSLLTVGGWLDVAGTQNIIPDHYAPYECRNVDVYFDATQKDAVLFKGDGDRDRPAERPDAGFARYD